MTDSICSFNAPSPPLLGAYSVPGSRLKELKAVQENYPGQLAESKAPGKTWWPGKEEAVLKGDGSRHRRQAWPTSQLAACPVDGYFFSVPRSQELGS